MKLSALKAEHVQDAVDKMKISGLAPATIVQAVRALSSALTDARRRRLIPTNVCSDVVLPKRQRSTPKWPTPAEVRKVMDAAAGTAWSAMIALLAGTGCRHGEACALTWQAVHLDAPQPFIEIAATMAEDGTVHAPKTLRSRRTVALPAFLVDILRAHRAEQAERKLLPGPSYNDAGFVFADPVGNPLLPNSLTHAFLRYARSVGVGCRVTTSATQPRASYSGAA